MTIGDRIKKLRRELDLTQQQFGEKLSIKGNTISQYESKKSNPVDSVVSLICREFNVSEEWLREGVGEMFKPEPADELANLAKKYNLSNAAYIVVEKFVNLKPEKQKELIDFIVDVSQAIIECESDQEESVSGISQDLLIQAMNNAIPRTPEELERSYPPEGEKNGKTG